MIFTMETIQIAAFLGAALSVGIASITCGMGVGYIASAASYGIMRQPDSHDKLFRAMFIGQAVTETGGIFSLVIALLLMFGGFDVVEGGWFRFAALLSAGIAVGLGSLGPVTGAGYAGGQACHAISRMPRQSNSILGYMLIGQALAQTSSIFALLVSLLLLYSTPLQDSIPNLTAGHILLRSVAYIGAGLAIGIGTIGPGVGIGNVAGKGCRMIGKFPRQKSHIMRTMFLGAAVSQSTAIYALVVSFLLIFSVK
ncbi:MAG: ATP synthase F0 subunit C [Candidatus Cloacimonetes bacterium]|nr:ATP synthase F0 subunit C [Candidatus Cloacimonadota bacterium]